MVICAWINIAHIYNEGFRSIDKCRRRGLKNRSELAGEAYHFIITQIKANFFIWAHSIAYFSRSFINERPSYHTLTSVDRSEFSENLYISVSRSAQVDFSSSHIPICIFIAVLYHLIGCNLIWCKHCYQKQKGWNSYGYRTYTIYFYFSIIQQLFWVANRSTKIDDCYR